MAKKCVLLMVLIGCLTVFYISATTSSSTTTPQKKKTYDAKISRRERNLDHWDSETLAAYLGLDVDNLPKTLTKGNDPTVESYVGIDAAVMFYASWCQNCHRFAPIWDAIATMVQAGSTSSGLIMSLFNCEQDEKHSKLCDLIGITHYPTLMFIGAGPVPDALGSIMGKNQKTKNNNLSRTMNYRGNSSVGDSVLDWLQVMRGISTWYKWNHHEGGWLRFCRKGLLDFVGSLLGNKPASTKNTSSQLPIGVPPKTGAGGAGVYALQKELTVIEKKLDSTEKDLKDYKLAASHAGYLIESFLFPPLTRDENPKPLDIFSHMTENDLWTVDVDGPDKAINRVVKACFLDLTLDYCTRLSTKVTTEYVRSIEHLPDNKYPTLNEMELKVKSMLKDTEPYCALVRTCYKSDFKEDNCHPNTCPLKGSASACTYISSCLSDAVQQEYAEALGVSIVAGESNKISDSAPGISLNTTESKKDLGKKASTKPPEGTWGIK